MPEFRRMIPADLPQVLAIEQAVFPDPWSENMFRHELANENTGHAFVLLKEQAVIGYIVCLSVAGELHILNVAVIPQKQGNGYGAQLITSLFRLFPDYEVAYLEVREDNRPAIGLYQKFGFEAMYRRPNYYPNGKDALVMIKFPPKRDGEQNGLV